MNAWLVTAILVAGTPITLEEVEKRSAENFEALRAEFDALRSHESVRSAWAAIFPQVALSAQVGFSTSSAQNFFTTAPRTDANGNVVFVQTAVDVPGNTRGNFNLGLSVAQLLFDGGKWWNQIDQASAAQAAAVARRDEQRLASRLEGVRRFYDLLLAQRAVDVFTQGVERSERGFERAKALFQAARVSKRDALDAEVNLMADRLKVARSRKTVEDARAALASWLRLPFAAYDAAEPTWHPAAGPVDSQALLKKAHADRPLLRALTAQEVAASESVAVAQSGFWPRLSVGAGYMRSSPNAGPFFADWTRQHSVNGNVTLSWDLFSGMATVAAVDRARADERQATLELEQSRQALEGEVGRAAVGLSSSQEALALSSSMVALSQSSLHLAEERYAAGAGTLLEVRDAQLKVLQAQLELLQAHVDVEMGWAQVARVAGTLEGSP